MNSKSVDSAALEHRRITTRMTQIFVVLFLFPSVALCAQQQAQHASNSCKNLLIIAIQNRDSEGALEKIRSGAALDDNSCGVTALTESIATGQTELAIEIIRKGANVNLADLKGETPLMYASFYCQPQVVFQLLEQKAEVNALNSDRSSALMDAASTCNDGSVIAMLIRSGANVNQVGFAGETALTIAVNHGDEFAVKELVAAGADLNTKTEEGETALTIAQGKEVGRKETHDRIYFFLKTISRCGLIQ
jgi:ankyrin repeat protein